jgi:ADP-ribose diphosphatase
MPIKPEILKRRDLCSSRLFRVEELQLRFSNGVERTYERLRSGSGSAVIVVPLLNDKEFVLVREYGAGVDDYELALPKGRVEVGEDYCEAANRELMEEAGYGAKELTMLKNMTQSPNYMQHSTQIVVARQLYPQKCEGDEPEELEVETWPIDDIPGLVAREDFSEARSIAALYLARDWLRDQLVAPAL